MLTHLPASAHSPRTRRQGRRKERWQGRRQGGSLLVQFALLGSVLFLLLGVVDLGYMYYAKRDLQRIADLAATQAAQAINAERSNRAACVAAGEDSITANWPVPLTRNSTQTVVSCGNWNPADPARHPRWVRRHCCQRIRAPYRPR